MPLLEFDELGFEEGCIHEVILTTINEDLTPNVAPMGISIEKPYFFIVKPYIATRTYQNLSRTGEAVINITDDISLFCITILEREKVKGLPYLKAKKVTVPILADSKAYVECIVEKENVINGRRAEVVLKAVECKILNKNFRPLCRAPNLILESLIHLTRIRPLIEDGKVSEAAELMSLIKFYKEIVGRVSKGTTYEKLMIKIYNEAHKQVKRLEIHRKKRENILK